MTTSAAGGKITGLLALTLEAQSALQVGDPVHMVGDYQCDKADGSKPVVGFVSVRNVRRGTWSAISANNQGGLYPVANVPGDVTVEARGLMVLTLVAGGTITAGEEVGIGAGGLVASGAGVANVGIALNGATSGNKLDVLVGPTA